MRGASRTGGRDHEAHQGAFRSRGARSTPAGSWGASDGRARERGSPQEFQSLHGHVVTCSKCGFCQPVCPIFRATGREGYVARGKVTLYRNIIEDRLELGPGQRRLLQLPAVPRLQRQLLPGHPHRRRGGVVPPRLCRAFRPGFLQRRVFRSLLPRPRLMRGLVRFIWAFRRTGLDRARSPHRPARPDQSQAGTGPRAGSAASRGRCSPRACEAPGAAADRAAGGRAGPVVGYWISCGYNYVLPEVGESTVRVLERLGYEVEVLDNCCCGLAAYGYGDLEAATALARENLRRLGDPGGSKPSSRNVAVAPAISRSTHDLLAGDPGVGRAGGVAPGEDAELQRVRRREGGPRPLSGSSETGAGERAPALTQRCRAGCCAPAVCRHLSRPLPPRAAATRMWSSSLGQMLRSLPGVTFVEAAEADSCCGAAGTYGILHPETSAAIIKRKMGFIAATGASVVATECPSCMMQLRFGARASGLPCRVLNVSQICDARHRCAAPEAEVKP